MTLWLVRSGKYGEREALALENNLAIIGWEEVSDLSELQPREKLAETLEDTYPNAKKKTLMNWESQLWPFCNAIQKGDRIVMPLKTRPTIAIGEEQGPYEYRTDFGDVRHTRAVKWQKEVSRDSFAQDLLYSFGSFMTVCRIFRIDAEVRVQAVFDGKRDPGLSGGTIRKTVEAPEQDASLDESSHSLDLLEVAEDEIRKKIGVGFKGHRLANLVASVLEAEGYAVKVSPPGADGGADIVAGKGTLGLDDPRLVVQVKSQEAPVDVAVFRELQGVMTQFGADQGLLVAWGGVTKSLAREAAKHFFEIRIWDANDVVKAVQQNYEKLAGEMKAELPLKQIWVLADDE